MYRSFQFSEKNKDKPNQRPKHEHGDQGEKGLGDESALFLVPQSHDRLGADDVIYADLRGSNGVSVVPREAQESWHAALRSTGSALQRGSSGQRKLQR